MSDQTALLAAIVAHPDDDTPRLVYADWLQEHDRPEEAEFLRVQCRLAAADPGDPEFPALTDRDEELRLWLTAHVPGPRPTFAGGLSVQGGSHWWWQSHRGFPRFLNFDGRERPGAKAMRALAAGLARAFDALPTRWLVVTSVTVAQLTALLKQPVLAGLSHLTLHISNPGEDVEGAARLLAKCRHLRNLRGLSLAFWVGDAGCEALAAAAWDGLEWFAPDCYRIGPAGLRALAGASWFRGLRELVLEDALPDDTFEALGRLPALPRLHTLNLSRNNFTVAAWRAFARTRSFPALAGFRLDDGNMSDGRAASLAAADGFALRGLHLYGGGLGPGDGAALAAAPWARHLRALGLAYNDLGPTGAKAVVGSAAFAELRHLDLSNSALGPTGLDALAANPALRGLRALDLSHNLPDKRNRLTPAHFERFLAKLDLPDLRHLNLTGRPLGARAARQLTAPRFAALTRLGLDGCRLTDPAVAALLAAPALGHLIELRLNNNRLTTGPERLTDRSVLPRLASCTLGGNLLPGPLARKLRRRPGVYT